ncbi:hypothetical protein U9M48_037597 [Paspalum notatum var. saurae]|uniref:Uncharacterized protein n=1 Tax=Paspalum notatum var. saurae TaxID=547442 RepID=A0AAQ3UK29_PASNO
MNSRRFLNLVTEDRRTRVCSLRRINLATHLFYPSTAAAEAATARREAAIKANAERRATAGLRLLRAMATKLGRLPAPRINVQHAGRTFGECSSLDLAALLGDESKILCVDTLGRTCVYDADSHSVLTAPSLDLTTRAVADQGAGAGPGGAIHITIARRTTTDDDDDTWRSTDDEHVYDSLYVMSGNPGGGHCWFQELNYNGNAYAYGTQVFRWTPLPPPPFHRELYHVVTAHAVVGSTIYVSSRTRTVAPTSTTYSFNTVTGEWKHVGGWMLPFDGKAEHVPELNNNLWFGLAGSHPFHLCAADLSDLGCTPPPLLHAWHDLDMPEDWVPQRLHLINLGSGRFCVLKILEHSAVLDPSDYEYYDNFDGTDDEIDCGFAVLTGVEVVVDHGGGGGLRMIKHKSRYHMLRDHTIECVL